MPIHLLRCVARRVSLSMEKLTKLLRMWQNPRISLGIRLAFASLVLTLLFARIDFVSTLDTLIHFDRGLVVPLLVIYFLSVYVMAYQMSFGVGLLGMRFRISELAKIKLIAIFYSLVFLGDLAGGAVAWYKLSRPERKGVEAGALLIYFRLLNLVTLSGIGLVGMWFDSRLSSPGFRVVVGIMFIGVILMLLPFFSPAVTHLIERSGVSLLHRSSSPAWMSGKLRATLQSLRAFQSLPASTITLMLLLSLLYHGLGILSFYLLGKAVGIHQSVFLMGWLRSLLMIIQLVPVSVAGLGIREASVVFILHNYGIPEVQALGLSFAVVGMMAVGGAVGGILEGWDLLLGRRRASHSISERQADAATGVSA